MNNREVLEGLKFRHACKVFDEDRRIPHKDFEAILESGRLAPSSMGIEPWSFLVIQNKRIRKKIAEVSWGGKNQIPTASHIVIALSRKPEELKYDSQYIDSLLRETKKLPDETVNLIKGMMKAIEDKRFNNNYDAFMAYSENQTYIAATTMVNTAAYLGIDSCFVGGIDKEAVTKILEAEGILDTAKFEVSIALAFGYRVNEQGGKPRREMDEVVEWIR